MIRHLLVPTDGSELSLQAARAAVDLATSTGARITFFHAVPTPTVFHYLQEASSDIDTNPSLMSREEIAERMERDAADHLEMLCGMAAERNVRSDATTEVSEHPHRAILEAAERHCCDLILMASHGRQGLGALLLGSETQKVLTHGHLPVLVWRG